MESTSHHIMPLVFSSLMGKHTQKHTHTETYTHIQIFTQKHFLRNPICTGHRLMCPWFKNSVHSFVAKSCSILVSHWEECSRNNLTYLITKCVVIYLYHKVERFAGINFRVLHGLQTYRDSFPVCISLPTPHPLTI